MFILYRTLRPSGQDIEEAIVAATDNIESKDSYLPPFQIVAQNITQQRLSINRGGLIYYVAEEPFREVHFNLAIPSPRAATPPGNRQHNRH
jgi:hypothetical protein